MAEDTGFDLDSLFVDQDVAESGVWVKFFGNSELLISSTEGKKYKSLLARLYKKNRLSLDDTNEEYVELIQDLTAEALATAVLRDWKNINIGGQKNVPYTPAMGKLALLSSGKLQSFVTEKAGDPSLFRAKQASEKPDALPEPAAAPALTSVS